MSRRIVKHALDLANPAPLTQTLRDELDVLKTLADDTIDTQDISPLQDAFWRNAVPNPFYRPVKTSTTVRIDSDVLAWLKAPGKGYRSRLNAILRREMLASLMS